MRDPILAGLVTATAGNSQLEFPIVVVSHGLVIEGTLVAQTRWLDEMATLLEAGSARAAAFGAVFRTARASIEMAAAVGDHETGLLHLLGASVRSSGRLEAVGLWRVALEAVDGWKLGAAGVPRAVANG